MPAQFFDTALGPWQGRGMMADSLTTNALQSSAFQRFFVSRIAYHFAMQIMTTAVGWQVWAVTHKASYLAWIGLAVFLPVLLLVVPAGLAADRYDRKLILGGCMMLEGIAAVGLLIFSILGGEHIWIVYFCLVLIGVASAFGNPAASSLVPNMLSNQQLAHGISLNTMTWQSASVVGPALGGVLLLFGSITTYGVAFALMLAATMLVFGMGFVKQTHHENPDAGLGAVMAGF